MFSHFLLNDEGYDFLGLQILFAKGLEGFRMKYDFFIFFLFKREFGFANLRFLIFPLYFLFECFSIEHSGPIVDLVFFSISHFICEMFVCYLEVGIYIYK